MTLRVVFLCWLYCVNCLHLNAGEFINLGFDQPNTNGNKLIRNPSYPQDFTIQGKFQDLLPGWTAFQNGFRYTGVAYYRFGTVDAPVLVGPDDAPSVHDYFFEYNRAFDTGFAQKFSLQQVGDVPPDAWELRTFKGAKFMSMYGIELSYRDLPGFNQRAYDVHQFAGKEVTFEIRNYDEKGFIGSISIDILGFATPEPSTWVLLVFGGGLLCWAVRRGGREP